MHTLLNVWKCLAEVWLPLWSLPFPSVRASDSAEKTLILEETEVEQLSMPTSQEPFLLGCLSFVCSSCLTLQHWAFVFSVRASGRSSLRKCSRDLVFLQVIVVSSFSWWSTMLYRSEVCCSHGLPMEMIPQWATQPQAKVVSFFSLPSHLTGAAGKGWSWPWGPLGL